MRRLWIILLFGLMATPACADRYLTYRDGLAEYDRGNIEAAFATYRRLAESGDAESQAALGLMFHIGDAVAQNHATAAIWFRRAAEQGLAAAQYNLGILYANGHGVSRDDVRALKWFALAESVARNEEERDLAKANRARIAKRMAAADVAAAHGRACDWWRENAWMMEEPVPVPPGCTENR